MSKWYLREPSGLITRHYPFDRSYREVFKDEKVLAFVLTQDVGMQPSMIRTMVQAVLRELAAESFEEFFWHEGKEAWQLDSMTDLTEKLLKASGNAESAWYWDETSALLKGKELSVLLQPESDGMDIALYMQGEKAETTFESLKVLLPPEQT
jgi:hypothetical protein